MRDRWVGEPHRLGVRVAGYAGEVHLIGDGLGPRTAEEAFFEGFKVAVER